MTTRRGLFGLAAGAVAAVSLPPSAAAAGPVVAPSLVLGGFMAEMVADAYLGIPAFSVHYADENGLFGGLYIKGEDIHRPTQPATTRLTQKG